MSHDFALALVFVAVLARLRMEWDGRRLRVWLGAGSIAGDVG